MFTTNMTEDTFDGIFNNNERELRHLWQLPFKVEMYEDIIFVSTDSSDDYVALLGLLRNVGKA